jgi:hypothetical protein
MGNGWKAELMGNPAQACKQGFAKTIDYEIRQFRWSVTVHNHDGSSHRVAGRSLSKASGWRHVEQALRVYGLMLRLTIPREWPAAVRIVEYPGEQEQG